MTNLDKSRSQKRLFIVLWCLCIAGSWSVLPYVQYLGLISSTVSFTTVLLLATVQAVVIFGIVCWLSYLLVPKSELLPFSVDRSLKRIIYPGVIAGVAVGCIIYLLDIKIFKSSLLSGIHPPFWTGLLASAYGGINEEVLLRLFFFTFVYFLFRKTFRFEARSRLFFLWSTNLIVAIMFGLGHLPAAFKLVTPSAFEVLRVLLLNGIPGIVFGWLYWSKGLWAAMTAHFMTDLLIHVFLI
jgi:membrane protease YdiL (CAAX protease family)